MSGKIINAPPDSLRRSRLWRAFSNGTCRHPKIRRGNELHQKLAGISKKCHQLKLEGKEEEIEKLEKEDDELAKKLFGIEN